MDQHLFQTEPPVLEWAAAAQQGSAAASKPEANSLLKTEPAGPPEAASPANPDPQQRKRNPGHVYSGVSPMTRHKACSQERV